MRNSYCDSEVSSVSNSIGKAGGEDQDGNTGGSSITEGELSGLTTSEITGSTAETNMSSFDFPTAWTTTDEYPELAE